VYATAAPEHTTLAHIGERDRAEIEVDLIAELFPEIVRGATGSIAAAPDRRARSASRRADRLVDSKDDVGNAGLAAAIGEKIAAAWTRTLLTSPPLRSMAKSCSR
jgi:hypothetical protein